MVFLQQNFRFVALVTTHQHGFRLLQDVGPKIARIFNLDDKFITPQGIFKTKKEIQKVVGIPEWTLNTIYNDLDAYPVTNGRASKKINHLNIDPTKTWRDNGFGLLAVP